MSDSPLTRLVDGRQAYLHRCNKLGPLGTNLEEWSQWISWRNARRDAYDTAIREIMDNKRDQQRRKFNERKRDHGASRRHS